MNRLQPLYWGMPLATLLAGILLASLPCVAGAQDYPPLTPQRRYNGIVAGEEAYQANEARRRAEIGNQVGLNADMFWRWSGAGSWWPGVFEPWPMVPGDVWGYPATTISTPPLLPMPSVRRSIRAAPRPPLAVELPAPSPELPGSGPRSSSGPREF